MTALELQFSMDNAAFQDAPHLEAARVLREAADRLEREGVDDGMVKRLRCANGANVGYWHITS